MTLFTSFSTDTSVSIRNTEAQIAHLERQLEECRQDLAQLQQLQQAQMSATAAANNALEMARKARVMVEYAFGTQAVHEFNLALIDAVNETTLLEASVEPDEPTAPTPTEPTEPTASEPTVPTVSETPIIDVNPVQVTIVEPKEEATQQAEREYSTLSWKELQKFASQQGINPKGKKRSEIEALLASNRKTQSDIDQAA